MQALDSSHRCVLDNLDSLQRAQRCLTETEEYLWSVLESVPSIVSVPAGLALEWETNRRHFYLQAKAAPVGTGSKCHLLAVGLENLTVTNLMSAEANPGCSAFIFSPVLEDPKGTPAAPSVVQALRALTAPAGFAPPAVTQEGYLFVKPLERVPVATFCSRAGLTEHFRASFNELVAWLASVSPQLIALNAQPSARRSK